MNEPQRRHIAVNHVELAYYEWNKPRSGRPTLLFLHCTGLHARVWDRIIEAFPDLHVIALDLRGHGRSEKRLINHWKIFGEDIAALTAALRMEHVVGIGHSVGGHGLVDAAAKSGAFAQLILCDPTIVAPEIYRQPARRPPEGETHPAAKRKRAFASPEEMLERLRDKGSYPLFEPRILWDYCQYGLLPADSGGYTLACPPEVEASVYAAWRTNVDIYDRVRTLDIPVFILRARLPPAQRQANDYASSPTFPGLVDEFPHGEEIHLAQCSHFIPMQMPREVIAAIQNAVSTWRQSE